MIELKDQTGNMVRLENIPGRIISVVPSITELLYDLGLNDEVIAITKFCVHPEEWFHNKTRIGGTKNLNIEKIKSLEPQLIIASKEENEKTQIELLATFFPVYISDIKSLGDALQMIKDVGILTRKQQKATEMVSDISKAFEQLNLYTKPVKCCYLIWQNPLMAAGGDTFINDMLRRCGLENVFQHETRYPQISLEEIVSSGSELVLLSSEPFPFSPKHAEQLAFEISRLSNKNTALPIKIKCVDGEMFSWYGSRLRQAPHYFEEFQNFMMS